ncbi:MAG: hypothetical protein JNJ54_34770 [Myxococcaceae bacterium]|nr:hypothetical protein [Myxococcaceae bacterium]
MRRVLALFLLAFAAGCGPGGSAPDGGATLDAGSYTPVESRLLGLNDITWLFPLPSPDAGSPFPPAETMIPQAPFDRLSTTPGDVVTDLRRLQLVGMRFDICDRATTAPCAQDADGVIRLVLQPTFNDGSAEDIALHAFYPVPRGEVYAAVDTLRALARLQDVRRQSALRVNAALTTNAEYTSRLVAFLRRYAVAPNMFRLTLFGQLSNNPAQIWVFRGVEQKNGQFVRIEIPDIREVDQVSLLFSATEFRTMPQADNPVGFARAMSASAFSMATPSQQRQALEAMAATDNPKLNTADTVQCVSCHVTTTVMMDRATTAGVDVASLTSRYLNTDFDMTPLGDPGVRFRTLRALGWFRRSPLVAQRTVNETANVLAELEVRYPAAP